VLHASLCLITLNSQRERHQLYIGSNKVLVIKSHQHGTCSSFPILAQPIDTKKVNLLHLEPASPNPLHQGGTIPCPSYLSRFSFARCSASSSCLANAASIASHSGRSIWLL
jgi:hypothetical protein